MTPPNRSKTPSETASYRIGAVAKRTGLSSHTIRVWERRYGAVTPHRTQGGTREYSEEDVERLLLLNTLNQAGHTIGRIASRTTDELLELLRVAKVRVAKERGFLPEVSKKSSEELIDSLLSAVAEMDVRRAERILFDASAVLGPLATIFDIIAPLVEAIGDRWQSGEFGIANEHAATAALRTLLGQFMGNRSSSPDMPIAVVATLSGERHELGALMAAFIAATRGFNVIYLGADLPGDEISHVVETKDASLLMLSIVNAREERSAQMLRKLKSQLRRSVRLLVGGRSATRFADILDADERMEGLRELYDQLGNRAPPQADINTLQ